MAKKTKKKEDHNPNSPSQLKTRYLCPGSVNLINKTKFQDRETDAGPAAARGTFLHDVCEAVVGGKKSIDDFEYAEPGDKTAALWCIQQVLKVKLEYSNVSVVLEQQVNLDALGIPSGEKGNRVDVFLVCPDAGIIVILDYKFGVTWADRPRYNWQFKAYAWGVWNKFGGKAVRCVKLQPELEEKERFTEHTFTADDMETIGNDIKTIVERTKDPNAPLVRDDKEQCFFCKVMQTCPLFKNAVLKIPRHLSMALHWLNISPAEREVLYLEIGAMLKWGKKAMDIITAVTINDDLEMTGHKVDFGKKKVWKDEQKALLALQELADLAEKSRELLVKPAELISVSAVHAIFGNAKNVKEYVGKLWEEVDGKAGIKKIKVKKEKLL